jgi:hypothetical protein
MGIYDDDGKIKVTVADGNSRGRYAPDGSFWVNVDSGNLGIYGPNGCLNVISIIDGNYPMSVYSPEGNMYAILNGGTGILYLGASLFVGGSPPGIVFNSIETRSRLRTMRQRVQANTGRVRVYAGHDSTMYGQGTGTGANNSVGAYDKSILAKAAIALNTRGISALAQGQIGDGGRYSTMIDYNPRWTSLGAGWVGGSASGGTDPALGGYVIRNNTDNSSLVYTPTVNVDSFDVLYSQNSSQADFSLAINGGSATVINPTGTAAILSTTKSGTLGTSALTITRTGATGFIRLIGLIPYDSTTSAFDLVMASIPGASTSRVNGSATQSISPLPALQQLKPDIWLSLGGINDMRVPVTAAVSRNNLQTTFNAISNDTDMICIAPNRFSDVAVPESTQDAWRDMLYSFCSDNGITLIDPTLEFPTYASMVEAGYMTDLLHPNELWTEHVANLVATTIQVA